MARTTESSSGVGRVGGSWVWVSVCCIAVDLSLYKVTSVRNLVGVGVRGSQVRGWIYGGRCVTEMGRFNHCVQVAWLVEWMFCWALGVGRVEWLGPRVWTSIHCSIPLPIHNDGNITTCPCKENNKDLHQNGMFYWKSKWSWIQHIGLHYLS